MDPTPVPPCPDSDGSPGQASFDMDWYPISPWFPIHIRTSYGEVWTEYVRAESVNMQSSLWSVLIKDGCAYSGRKITYLIRADYLSLTKVCIRKDVVSKFTIFVPAWRVCPTGTPAPGDIDPVAPIVITGGGGGPVGTDVQEDEPDAPSVTVNIYTETAWQWAPTALHNMEEVCDPRLTPAALLPSKCLPCMRKDASITIISTTRVMPNGSYKVQGSGPYIVWFWKVIYSKKSETGLVS